MEFREPCFLLGCGRSGTTITTHLLGRHPDVLSLNEPGKMWQRVYLQFGGFGPHKDAAKRKLRLTEDDTTFQEAQRMRAIFACRQARSGKLQLVEKTPLNSLRVRFLATLFPNAKFIFLLRDGTSVAKSIARTEHEWKMKWYGHRDSKWRLILQEAELQGFDPEPLKKYKTHVERGMVEWSLTTRTTHQDLREYVPDNRRLHVRYENLINTPDQFMRDCYDFLELPYHAEPIEYAKKKVKAKSRTHVELPDQLPDIFQSTMKKFNYKVYE